MRLCISYFLFWLLLSTYASFVYANDTTTAQIEKSVEYDKELLDSLQLTYTNLNDSTRIKKIIADCRTLGYFHPDEIIVLIDETVEEVRKTNNKRAEIQLLFQKGYILSDAYSDLEGSGVLFYYMLENLPLTLVEQINTLDFIARTHLAKSELVKAQQLYEEALKLLQQMDKPYSSGHINVFWGIAVTYSESHNYEKSSDYYLKCLEQSRHFNEFFMMSSCYQNLASNAGKMNQWEASISYLDSAYLIINKIPNKSDQVISEMGLLNAYGDFYSNNDQLDSAVICFRKSIQLSDEYNDFYTKSYALQALGVVFLELNRLDEAETSLLSSYEMFSDKTPSLLLENSFNLYRLYKKKGAFNESLKWYETYTALRDSVQKAENVAIIAEATTKYEVELKDKTIDLLNKEKKLETQEKEKYKSQWQIIIVLLLLLLVLGAFYINHNRHQKSKKKILNQVVGEERERKRISMELHDGVCAQITTLSRMVKDQDETKGAAWLSKVAEKLDNLNLEVRDISHNLSLVKYDQSVTLQDLIEDYTSDLGETFLIRFEVNFKPNNEQIFLETSRELVLFRIIQEICNNAIKYSGTKNMRLTFFRKENDLKITISDYGIGFDSSTLGNGIKNIFERVAFLEGKVALDTKTDGTTFTIKIPLKPTELSLK